MMESKKPFSQEVLNAIFKVSSSDPERVISRESSSLEFKESFGWASLPKYMKTSAAFANAKGGYIVFGIANKPHTLSGLSGTSLKLFESFDPEKMSQNFNDYFAPEIEWEVHIHELQGTTLTTGFNKKRIIKTKGIRTSDIVLEALNQGRGIEPIEYIKQACHESAAFLPIFYFIKQSQMTPKSNYHDA